MDVCSSALMECHRIQVPHLYLKTRVYTGMCLWVTPERFLTLVITFMFLCCNFKEYLMYKHGK